MRRNHTSLLAGFLSSAAVSAVISIAPAAHAEDQAKFNIPPQSLASALKQFGHQSGRSILAEPSLAKAKTTRGVNGRVDIEAALAQILENTGLSYRRVNGAYLIVSSQATAQNASLGDAQAPESVPVDLAEQNTVEEVIVRATKRDESIMQVPVSMTAVTAADIDRIGAKNLEDLAKSVPGVVIRNSSEQIDKTYVIRGISSNARSSTVAVYIDDTPITFGTYTPDLKLIDVAQIEFLRGPQGTLFGSSSMGGAIRYTSQEPSFGAVSGMVKAEGGLIQDGGADYELQGAVGGPLIEDRLAFRASAFARRDGGYVDLVDEDTGKVRKDDVNTVDTYGGRFMLKARLGEDIDASLSAIYQQSDADYLGTYFSARGMDAAIPLPAMSRVDRTDVYRNDKTFLPNLTLNADLGFAKLTSSTSYMKREFDVSVDFSYYVQRALGLPDALARDFTAASLEGHEIEGWSQEVRLVSQGDGPFEWIVGAFYSKNDVRGNRTSPTNLATVLPPLSFLLPFYNQTSLIEREQKAVFGEASLTLAEKLKLTAGVRLTDMNIRIFLDTDGAFNGGHTVDDNSSSEKPVTPKFSAQYTFNPDAMVYAMAAKGFREGGPNNPVPTGIPACAAALAAIGLSDAPTSYDTDTVWSYEIGTKLQTSDRRFRFVGSVYRIDWDEIQQTILLTGGCGSSLTANLGKARSQGFEAESNWRPTDDLRIDLSVGYTDAKLTEDLILGSDPVNGPIVAAPSGRRLPDVPIWTAMLAAQYEFQPFGEWDAFVRGELQYIGKSKRHLGTPTDDPRSLNAPAFTLVNLRLGAAKGPYEIDLFVNNLFDDDTEFYKNYDSFAPGPGFDEYEAQRNRPRTLGASIKRRF